ncbi:type II and III secretion system protein family protein, partial [Candidatus Hamiltonella defensa]
YPESQVQIEKIGKSYLLTGMAPTEEVRDNIVRMVGESIQSRKSNDKDTVSVRLGMSDKSDASEATENVNSSLTNKVYERVINQIQLPVSNQVNVKLSIVEVSKEFKDNIGFEWANLGTFSFHKFNFTADRITHLVNALQDDSIARVLAEPNLSVLSGESASFLVGGEIPYVKDRDASNRASIDFKEFGIKLSVTAKVNENKRIKVMLSEEISSVIGNTKAEEFTMPSLKKRRANTTVELADGESFVLGGLMNQEEQEALQKVPFIGDIPILGSFFRHTKTNNRSIELIVVATVNLVKPIPSKEITLPDFMKTPSIARFLNLSVIKNISQKKEAEEFLGKGGFIQ